MGDLNNNIKKHILTIVVVVLFGHMLFGLPATRRIGSKNATDRISLQDSTSINEDRILDSIDNMELNSLNGAMLEVVKEELDEVKDSLLDDLIESGNYLNLEGDAPMQIDRSVIDSITRIADSTLLVAPIEPDSLEIEPFDPNDTVPKKAFLDDVIEGKYKDSLVFDLKNNMIYGYRDGDVTYQDINLKADYMEIDIETKNIFAHGYEVETDSLASMQSGGGGTADTTEKVTRPELMQGGSTYEMDTVTFNLETNKAIIKGVITQEGEGFLIGERIKKMADNSINISDGIYTTCDNPEPHFCIKMPKAKVIPGKKIITGPVYLHVEGVDIPFIGSPFAFFPFTSGRQSGLVVPEYGEEYVKGFFLRNGGYYFAFNDYIDITALGGFYTLGSWETSLASRYTKKYKYSGGLNMRYSKDIIGEKEDPDYVNTGNFSMTWSHSQDPKFKPNSTFSASVNFSSSGYSKYGSTNMNDYLNTQTNSSIAYSKSWAGTPFSFSTNMQHSQNSRDTTISLSFPSAVFNMSNVFPFKRKEVVGKERWYEKISLRYTGNLANNVTTKEDDLFTDEMFKQMKNGVKHTIPISTSLNILKYINVSPNMNYTERWYFSKIDKEWDADQNRVVNSDTTSGFYRVFNYDYSASASTKVYGTYQFGPKFPIQAIRHVLTPNIGFTYVPDFGADKFGYYKPVQSNAEGDVSYYSPYEGGMYGVPGRGKSASITFGLSQTLEMKVKSERDTSGVRKIKIIENFGVSSSYNFLADSLNLSTFSLSLRTTLYGNFGLNLSATLDPYVVDKSNGRRINKFMLKEEGKIGRITSTSWAFGYTFNSKKSDRPAINDINSGVDMDQSQTDFFSDPQNQDIDANTRRVMMTSKYYDFSIPWNLGFNYSLGYRNNGVTKNIDQTLGFNGSVTLTKKWGTTFSGGYDFEAKELTPGTVTISRDLHCWQMGFTWVPIGFRKSWSFNIGVKSAMLSDLKYDKRSSFYDNLYD